MLGVLFLLVALICYFRNSLRWFSYVIYIGFLSKGYVVFTDQVLGFKNQDLAIVYTFIICLYLLLTNQFKLPRIVAFRWVRIFMVFLICSVFFSLFYYHFTPYQILQGGRSWLLIFCLPILIRMSHNDFQKVIKSLSYITLVTSAVYIAQIVVGRPIMPYGSEGGIDRSTGLIRLYNFPPHLSFFLVLTFVNPNMFKRVWLWRAVLIVALISTLGRTMIFSTLLIVIIAAWIQGSVSRFIRTGVILLVVILLFADIISERFEQGNTSADLQTVMQGGYEDYEGRGGTTMTYRIALLYERAYYLAYRPIVEQIFGMGFISDSQPITHKMYRFVIGLRDSETGQVAQLWSPDIAWVNTICGLGFLGTAIYFMFYLTLAINLYRHRRINKYYTTIAVFVLCDLITSFAGSGISECRNLAIYFIVMSTSFFYTNNRRLVTRPTGVFAVSENTNQGNTNGNSVNEQIKR